MRAARPSRLVLWALLPLAGWLELLAAGWVGRRAPRFADYAQLVAPVRAWARPGDAVVVTPSWAEPLVRQALGDELMPLDAVGRGDLSRFARAIEISLDGGRAAEARDARFDVREERRVGPFTLRLLANPRPQPVRYDFVAHAHPPEATVSSGAPPADCPFVRDATVIAPHAFAGPPTLGAARFRCEPTDARHDVVATTIADEQARPRRCLWLSAPATGARSVRFDDVPLGRRIVGHTGVPFIIERARNAAPLELDVVVDGERLATVVHRDGDGWAPFSVPLGAHADAAHAQVELRARRTGETSGELCVEAIAQ
jgi:hypothetical protein